MKEQLIQRYSAAERINHWIVAVCFILLALSGLAMFHPAMAWLYGLFGGGQWTRILHPFFGIVMLYLPLEPLVALACSSSNAFASLKGTFVFMPS